MAGITETVVFFLAVWRLSKMATEEEGPGMVFHAARELSGATFGGIPEDWDNLTWYGKLFQCPYCLSVWVALILAILHITNDRLYRIVVLSLSGSAATVLIEDMIDG